jgi:hypothetical protein
MTITIPYNKFLGDFYLNKKERDKWLYFFSQMGYLHMSPNIYLTYILYLIKMAIFK